MAKNFLQEGETIGVTAPYQVSSGGGLLIGTLFGVAQSDAANGAAVQIATCGVFNLPKTQALAIAIGDRVFWDDTNKVVNKTTAGQQCVGWAISAAQNPSNYVDVLLGQPNAQAA